MHKTLKRALAALCAVLLLTLPGLSALADEDLPAEEAFEEEAAPVVFPYTEVLLYTNENEYIGTGLMVDSVTYVPLVTFLQLMLQCECEVDWDQETCTATLTAENFAASLSVDQNYMTVNGRYLYFPDGVYNVNGTIIVPIRELAKVFGLELIWDAEAFSIRLSPDEAAIFESGDTFYNENDLYWLSHVISSEARNQPLDGMIGVGNAVLNRLNDPSGAFGSTLEDVIFQEGQFDVVRSGSIYQEPIDIAVVAGKLCLEGYNTVGDSKWFVNPKIGSTSWFKNNRTLVVSIADHDFYA